MNKIDDNVMTEIFSFLNAKERINISLVNKYIFGLNDHDKYWERVGQKLGYDAPKAKARKYKTWKSIIMRESKKLCKSCLEAEMCIDSRCTDCFVEKRNKEGTPEIRKLRWGLSVYLNQTEILSHYHLKKEDISHLPCHYIRTRYYDIYQYEQDKSFFDIPVDRNSILIDLIYVSSHTLFLNRYKNKVKKSVNGLEMLIFQAIKSIEIWTETTYNVDQKLDSIKKQLEKVIC